MRRWRDTSRCSLSFSGWRESLTKLIDDPPYPQWYYNASAANINRFELFTDEGFLSLIKEDEEMAIQ